jgi:hypothetical protein
MRVDGPNCQLNTQVQLPVTNLRAMHTKSFAVSDVLPALQLRVECQDSAAAAAGLGKPVGPPTSSSPSAVPCVDGHCLVLHCSRWPTGTERPSPSPCATLPVEQAALRTAAPEGT